MLLDPKIVADFWFADRSGKLTEHQKRLNLWLTDLMVTAFWDDGDADYAWAIVQAIHARDPELTLVGVFSAGPVEDLLSYHGPAVIDRIENKAEQDPKFAQVLGGVWQADMPDEIWKRVKQARDTSIWSNASE